MTCDNSQLPNTDCSAPVEQLHPDEQTEEDWLALAWLKEVGVVEARITDLFRNKR